MTDMDAFDRLIASEVVNASAPPRPVDDAAIFTAISATQSPKWGFQSMFSAAKFVVAGAIVALFGGFLLAGVMTQPSDEVVPAAVTDSPEPATPDGLLPGVELVTEEVESGVFRVLGDGVRDPSKPQGDRRVFVAPDGQVWQYTSQDDSPPTLVKLGDPGSYAEGLGAWPDIRFAPDGTPWALVEDADTIGSSIQRFDGSGWSTVRDAPTDGGWDIGPDGVVWAGGTFGTLLRLDDSGWTEYPIDFDGLGLRPTMDAFREAMVWDPDEEAAGEPSIRGVRVDGHGAVWVELAFTRGGDPPMALVRFDGESWSLADPLGVETYYNVDLLDGGSDGTVWVYLETERPPEPAWEDPAPYLARLVGDEWTVFSEADGVARSVWKRQRSGLLRVDRDGAVWVVAPSAGYRGIRTFDGSTWQSFLDDDRVVLEGTAEDGTTWMQSLTRYAVDDMEVAPDGSVWVLASGGLYVITPEAVAATEEVEERDT